MVGKGLPLLAGPRLRLGPTRRIARWSDRLRPSPLPRSTGVTWLSDTPRGVASRLLGFLKRLGVGVSSAWTAGLLNSMAYHRVKGERFAADQGCHDDAPAQAAPLQGFHPLRRF